MDRQASTYRTDDQLLAMFDQTSEWVVNNGQGIIVGVIAASLRDALQAAEVHIRSGETVRAISRLPPNTLIVFRDQMERLMHLADAG